MWLWKTVHAQDFKSTGVLDKVATAPPLLFILFINYDKKKKIKGIDGIDILKRHIIIGQFVDNMTLFLEK